MIFLKPSNGIGWRPKKGTLPPKATLDISTRLGLIYLRGSGVPKNMKEAEKWLRMAAEQDMSEAQNDLGVVYTLGGDGLAQNPPEAYKWLWIASKGSVVRGKSALDILRRQMTPQQIKQAEQAGRDWIKSH